MKVQKRFNFRVYPSEDQKVLLEKTFGCSRWVYNFGLGKRKEKISRSEVSSELTKIKTCEEYAWLKEVSSVPLQQALQDLNSAFQRFFRKQGRFPKFKRKQSCQSSRFTRNAFKYDPINRKLSLAKIGSLHVKWSRRFQSMPSSVTITKSSTGKYFVSLVLEEETQFVPKTGEKVGVDLGLKDFITLSDGAKVRNPRILKGLSLKLAKAQKSLSRKRKGSGRWEKQRKRVARIHEKVLNIRADFLHKLSTNLVKDYDFIALEDLAVKNMVKNRRLAKSISDASWSKFRAMLEYKALWYGKTVKTVNRFFPSSKQCSTCKAKIAVLTLDMREWECTNCGQIHDRDVNAAKNILEAGQALSARGERIRRKPVKGKRGVCRNVNQSLKPALAG